MGGRAVSLIEMWLKALIAVLLLAGLVTWIAQIFRIRSRLSSGWDTVFEEARQFGWSSREHANGCVYSGTTDGVIWTLDYGHSRHFNNCWRTEIGAVDGLLHFSNERVAEEGRKRLEAVPGVLGGVQRFLTATLAGSHDRVLTDLAMIAAGLSSRVTNEFRSAQKIDIDDEILKREFSFYATPNLNATAVSPALRDTLRIVAAAAQAKLLERKHIIDIQYVGFWRGGLFVTTSSSSTFEPSRLAHVVRIGVTLARALRPDPGAAPQTGLGESLQKQSW